MVRLLLVVVGIIGALFVLGLGLGGPTSLNRGGQAIAAGLGFLVFIAGVGFAALIDSCLQVRDALQELKRVMDKEPAGRGLLRTVLAEHAAEEEQAAEARAAELLASDGPPPQTAMKKAGES